MIKHISFDFWDTLYVGNPNFRPARAKYINKKYGHDPKDVHIAVKKTKHICDLGSELTMVTVDAKTQAWHLLDHLGCASTEGAVELALETHKVFLENPPIPVFTIEDLQGLKDRGISISISCNTGLISGDSINQMLIQTGIKKYFDFTLFSDHIRYFKPSPFFLGSVIKYPLCKANSFEEVLHVGDNPRTDGYMCQLTNSNFLLVEKGELDFKKINDYL